jgi:hypothetical protein
LWLSAGLSLSSLSVLVSLPPPAAAAAAAVVPLPALPCCPVLAAPHEQWLTAVVVGAGSLGHYLF